MVDYDCPRCGGGFPAAAATDDECPWCGREMNGDSGLSLSLAPERRVPTQGRTLDNWDTPDSVTIGDNGRIDPTESNAPHPETGEWR
jgi:hypothetical protein